MMRALASLALAVPQAPAPATFHSTECGHRSPAAWRAALDLPRASANRAPSQAFGTPASEDPTPCLSPAHVFPFEDTAGVLDAPATVAQVIALMTDAANALIAAHGDRFDFIGFFMNYQPASTFGLAFYYPAFNDVAGIGSGTFDNRPSVGLQSQSVQGLMMFYDVNDSLWVPGSAAAAGLTRLVLAHEYNHRWGVYLPELTPGRPMQGEGNCGSSGHWNGRVDAQGSGLGVGEWVGTDPAVNTTFGGASFNTEIPEGTFSYLDLYLMGMVSGGEMDALASELRYIRTPNCGSQAFGPTPSFSSADLVASAGARVPDSIASQKGFRTAWVMLHLPGDAPDAAELGKLVGILEQQQIDWNHSTLGRSTMSHQLFDDCNCNDVDDATDVTSGTSPDLNGNGLPDDCECGAVAYCTAGTSSVGCVATLSASGFASLSQPSGFVLAADGLEGGREGILFWGPAPKSVPWGTSSSTLCVRAPTARTGVRPSGGSGGQCDGSLSLDFNAWMSSHPAVAPPVGSAVYVQGWFEDPGSSVGSGLTDGLSFPVCP